MGLWCVAGTGSSCSDDVEYSVLSFFVLRCDLYASVRSSLILPMSAIVSCLHPQGEILAEHGGMGPEEAAAYLKTMAQEGRYLRDVWS